MSPGSRGRSSVGEMLIERANEISVTSLFFLLFN